MTENTQPEKEKLFSPVQRISLLLTIMSIVVALGLKSFGVDPVFGKWFSVLILAVGMALSVFDLIIYCLNELKNKLLRDA